MVNKLDIMSGINLKKYLADFEEYDKRVQNGNYEYKDTVKLNIPCLKNVDFWSKQPIKDNIQLCDTSNFEVGNLSFEEEPREVKSIGLYVFARDEADPICIELSTDQIIAISYDVLLEFEVEDGCLDELEEDYIMRIAVNQVAFLDALKTMAELHSYWLSDYFDNEDKEKIAITNYTEKCVKLAGGNKYKWFWMNFSGLL